MSALSLVTACPEWCTSKGNMGDGEDGHDGPSWPSLPIGGGSHRMEIAAGANQEGKIFVNVDAQAVDLTGEEAIQAGLHLIEAARWALTHQVVKKLDLTSEIAWPDMSAEAQSAFIRGVYSTFDPSTIE